jgi:hypothetical protein
MEVTMADKFDPKAKNDNQDNSPEQEQPKALARQRPKSLTTKDQNGNEIPFNPAPRSMQVRV